MTLAKFQDWFTSSLEQQTTDFITQAKLISEPDLIALIHHTQTIVLADGKRVRPYLCHVMHTEGEQISQEAISIYCAIELFHTFCLIHDDVIDHGEKRHGTDTLNHRHHALMQRQKRTGELSHIANAQAILVGDLLMSFVFNLINQYKWSRGSEVSILFYEMAKRVILGQMLDVDITTQDKANKSMIKEKMRLKTAEYTFVFPLLIGYRLSHDKDEKIEMFCQDFGTLLGLAFQTQDDLFDVLPQSQTKKSHLSDIREGQHTFLTHYVFEHGTREQQTILQQAWRKDKLDNKKIEALFIESGAASNAKKEIHHYITLAETALRNAILPLNTKERLNDLIGYIANRTS